jgi:ribosomal protein S18 acetylase RimI-like enzyme
MRILIRAAVADDLSFLREMLGEAATWDRELSDTERLAATETPGVARYIEGWGRDGDLGVVAESDGEPVGAAWIRSFPADAPGYGFIDESTPELSIAVARSARGRGVGGALLRELIERARQNGTASLSLSVEKQNPALSLYGRQGFEVVRDEGTTVTMRLDL